MSLENANIYTCIKCGARTSIGTHFEILYGSARPISDPNRDYDLTSLNTIRGTKEEFVCDKCVKPKTQPGLGCGIVLTIVIAATWTLTRLYKFIGDSQYLAQLGFGLVLTLILILLYGLFTHLYNKRHEKAPIESFRIDWDHISKEDPLYDRGASIVCHILGPSLREKGFNLITTRYQQDQRWKRYLNSLPPRYKKGPPSPSQDDSDDDPYGGRGSWPP